MLLICSHDILFTLNIAHSDLVIFIQVLEGGLDSFLFLLEFFLSGDELGRLLLELREDHWWLNHLFNSVWERFLVNLNFFLLDDEIVGQNVAARQERWQWHCRFGDLQILFLILVFVPSASLQADDLMDQALHLGSSYKLINLHWRIDWIKFRLVILARVIRTGALRLRLVNALDLDDQLFVIMHEWLRGLMYWCHRCLLLHLEAVVELESWGFAWDSDGVGDKIVITVLGLGVFDHILNSFFLFESHTSGLISIRILLGLFLISNNILFL